MLRLSIFLLSLCLLTACGEREASRKEISSRYEDVKEQCMLDNGRDGYWVVTYKIILREVTYTSGRVETREDRETFFLSPCYG